MYMYKYIHTHYTFKHVSVHRTSLVVQAVKHLPTMPEIWVRSLGWEDPLEKEMTTHFSTLAWKIPWTEESVRLQYMRSQRVGHNFMCIYVYNQKHNQLTNWFWLWNNKNKNIWAVVSRDFNTEFWSGLIQGLFSNGFPSPSLITNECNKSCAWDPRSCKLWFRETSQ